MLIAPLVLWLAAAYAPAADFPAIERSTAPIIIVRQTDESPIKPLLRNEFLMGSVSDPKGRLTINGQDIHIYPDGAFLAWLPVEPGSFTFHCLLALKDGTTAAYDNKIFVAPEPKILPEQPLAIDASSLWPSESMELRAGDWLLTRMAASENQTARFRFPQRDWLPMRQISPGVYEGAYQVTAADTMGPSPIEFEIGSGWSAVKAKTSALVGFTTASPLVAAVKSTEDALLKIGPSEGNIFPVPEGTPLVTIGRVGPQTKVWLSQDLSAWIDSRALQFMPEGTPPPKAVLDTISTKPSADGTTIIFSLSQRVPFAVEESQDLRTVTVRFYYTHSHDNWIIYGTGEEMADAISFRQENSDVVAASIHLKPGALLWGSHASFQGNLFKLELRRAPLLAAAPASPLKGIRVFLDPGHMPSRPGAFGPLGTREMDVNYAIAQEVKALLLQEGAVPLMSRQSPSDEVGLADRPQAAWQERADLFVSIHNNNIPDGENPFSAPHGYSIFYYHPHSLALAREVYRSYQKLVPISDENLRFGNLLVIRMTEMPAILIESAYMTFPDEEALLLTSQFRRKLAEAIVAGLRSHLAQVRGDVSRPKPLITAKPSIKKKSITPPKHKALKANKKPVKKNKRGASS